MSVIATRRERVVLELQDDFSTGMAKAAAAAALLNREVSGLNSARVNINVDHASLSRAVTQVTELRREMDRLGGSGGSGGSAGGSSSGGGGGGVDGLTAGFAAMGGAAAGAASTASSSINQLTGRLSLATDAILGLAPALIPIGALGGQAIGGLAAAATGAAIAGTSAIVAFQGVGDAVSAVAAYQLEPTVEGLEKAREAMALLGPDAQRFVMEFQKFTPVMTEIRDSAAAGWFPGLTESLDSFTELGPKISEIFFNVGEAGGFLVEDVAESLTSDRWTPFMDFIGREAPTAIGSLVSIMGDLAHGASEMFQAMDPGNDAFLGWIENVAQGFDDWASSTEGQDSIGGFLEYARVNGPAVQDLFVSLVGALGAIVQAAAPLAGPVLAGLTAVADMVKVIAESDMATPLLAAVAALRLFNRLQGAAIAGRGRFAAAMTGTPPVAGALGPAPTPLTGAGVYAYRRQQEQQARAAARSQRNRMVMGGAAGALAGGLLISGASEEIGLTNTAMLTLAGSMAGPVGAALGAVAGLSMDAAAANNDLSASLEAVNGVIESGDFASVTSGLAEAQNELASFKEEMAPSEGAWGNFTDGFDLGKVKNDLEGVFGMSDIEEAEAELARLQEKAQAGQEAVAGLGEAMGMTIGPVDGSARSIEELNGVLEAAKPAMDALGISTQEYLAAASVDQAANSGGIVGAAAQALLDTGNGGTDVLNDQIREQQLHMDSAQGKADNYSAALGALAREEGTAAERAQMLNDALSAMIDPALNAEEALDRQRQTLKEISELNAQGGFTPKTEVGRTNRDTTRQYVEDVKARLSAMVETKRSEEEVARALARSRAQFIQSGIAAGFSAKQMERRANAIGLTPKLVTTTFREAGISKTQQAVRGLRSAIKDMPESKRTRFLAEGVPKTMADVDRLVAKYKLTEEQRTALITLKDQASGPIANIRAGIASINSKTVTITTQHVVRGRPFGQGQAADGATIPKDGGPYTDRFLYMLAPGEEVITNRNGEADRFRSDRAAGRIPGYATGGTVGLGANQVSATGTIIGSGVFLEAQETARGLKALRKELKESTATLAKERARRADLIGTIRGNFTTDPFADDGGIWGSGSDPIGSLQGDVGDLRRFSKLVKGLDKRGLNGGALAEADTLAEVEVLSGMSNAELARYERLYNQRQRLAANVGGQYATSVTGMTVKELKKLAAEVRRVEKAIKQEGQKDRKNRDDNTDKAGDDRRASARRAAQRRRRNQD